MREVALRDHCYTFTLHVLWFIVNPGFTNVLQATCKCFLVGHVIDDCNNDEDDCKARGGGGNTEQCAKYRLFVESLDAGICGSDP